MCLHWNCYSWGPTALLKLRNPFFLVKNCHDWLFPAFTTWVKGVNESLHTMSLPEKCCLAEKHHLNLIMLDMMGLKLSTTLPQAHTYLHNFEEIDTFLLHTEVRWLSKGKSLAKVWVSRATSEILEQVATGITFQWHTMCHNTCLLMWHSQLAH